ncbi:hypothetical protein BaRGS_00014836 [Batillaria attramentaria]|uniref:Uncharacterized protein n=1 Tax=Batillaria attramentaria TaxID=370345 RepID=A0ABD0L3G8_9CAEN
MGVRIRQQLVSHSGSIHVCLCSRRREHGPVEQSRPPTLFRLLNTQPPPPPQIDDCGCWKKKGENHCSHCENSYLHTSCFLLVFPIGVFGPKGNSRTCGRKMEKPQPS